MSGSDTEWDRNNEDLVIHFSDVEITNGETLQGLGLIADSKISVNQHCPNVVKKTFAVGHFHFQKFHAQIVGYLVKLFKCYILPLLHYCCQLHFPPNMKSTKLVESIRRFFRRHFCDRRLFYLNYVSRLEHFLETKYRKITIKSSN